jgi:hypothetical protein
MIQDTHAGWLHPEALPGTANVDPCRRRLCCPPRPHLATIAAALAIAAVSAIAMATPVLLVLASAAADVLSP